MEGYVFIYSFDLTSLIFDIESGPVGRWLSHLDVADLAQVDMFAIFSLRRPDILPVGGVTFFGNSPILPNSLPGDLGVQRGLVRWFLSLHSPSHNYSISPEKVGGQSTTKKKATTKKQKEKAAEASAPVKEDELPIFGSSLVETEASTSELLDVSLPDISSVLPRTSEDGEPGDNGMAAIPPAFTPSIKKTLDKPAVDAGSEPVPLPAGIDVGLLKSRLDGKKKIKYVLIFVVEIGFLRRPIQRSISDPERNGRPN